MTYFVASVKDERCGWVCGCVVAGRRYPTALLGWDVKGKVRTGAKSGSMKQGTLRTVL